MEISPVPFQKLYYTEYDLLILDKLCQQSSSNTNLTQKPKKNKGREDNK